MSETPAVLILHGNDELAITEHIRKVQAGLGKASTADMNFARFEGGPALDLEALNTAVNAAPFLAPRRVVVLDHPAAAFSTPPAREKFLKLLEKAPPTSQVLLVEHEILGRDPRSPSWLLKWAAQAEKRAGVHLYALPGRKEMPRWLESEARKQGGRIDPDAAARLADLVGEDTAVAAQELAKLLTYVNFARPVRLLDVERVSSASAQGNIFDLVDALGHHNGKKAQLVLHQLLQDEDPAQLWGMIIRQFRLILQARELRDEHKTVFDLQKDLLLHEYVAGKVWEQARNFQMPALEAIYHRLLEIDEGAKTGQVPLEVALDTFIVELMQVQ